MKNRISVSLRISEDSHANALRLAEMLTDTMGYEASMTSAFEFAVKLAVNLLDNDNADAIPAALALISGRGMKAPVKQAPAKPARKTAKPKQEAPEAKFNYTFDEYHHDDELSINTRPVDLKNAPRDRKRNVEIFIAEYLRNEVKKLPWTGLPYQYLHELYKTWLTARHGDPGYRPLPYDEFLDVIKPNIQMLTASGHIDKWEEQTFAAKDHMTGKNKYAETMKLTRWIQVPEGIEFHGIVNTTQTDTGESP